MKHKVLGIHLRQVSVPEYVKAFARDLDDAQLDGSKESGSYVSEGPRQMLTTAGGSWKLNDFDIWHEKQVYVRQCYGEIADIMLEEKPEAICWGLRGLERRISFPTSCGVASKTMS